MSSLKWKIIINLVKYGAFISEGDVAPTFHLFFECFCSVYVVQIYKYIHASRKQEVCYVCP